MTGRDTTLREFRELFYGAIVAGLEGVPDDDTSRPISVLRTLAEVMGQAGHAERFDGTTTGELRRWAASHLEEQP